MEDPSYSRAHFRKCTILEQKGCFANAINLAKACIEELNDEMNFDEASKKVIPKF